MVIRPCDGLPFLRFTCALIADGPRIGHARNHTRHYPTRDGHSKWFNVILRTKGGKAFLLASALNGGVSISCPGMLDFAEVRELSFPLTLYNNYT